MVVAMETVVEACYVAPRDKPLASLEAVDDFFSPQLLTRQRPAAHALRWRWS